ncbi:MAG: Nif3-like dinuclear metal center hexameric protein [Acidobacteria bacterium]|nr:Nif3-like dinuclear metal center hexameric protein [Acidobacteriota bacterium]
MELKALVRCLDELLDTHSIEDESPNGLQVEGRAGVRRVAFAVDYSPEFAEIAAADGADLLFVHHGAIWGSLRYVRGVARAFLQPLFRHDLSLYVAHLPLDVHPELGHGACMARRLELGDTVPFGPYRGKWVGVLGCLAEPVAREAFLERVRERVSPEAQLLPFGPDRAHRVAIVSGGGAKMAPEAAEAGADFFLTGETSHGAYHPARAAGVNLCFGGHYRTETFGVLAVMERVRADLGLECRYYDFPTPF